jgi:hypothetical protein
VLCALKYTLRPYKWLRKSSFGFESIQILNFPIALHAHFNLLILRMEHRNVFFNVINSRTITFQDKIVNNNNAKLSMTVDTHSLTNIGIQLLFLYVLTNIVIQLLFLCINNI